MKSIKTNTLESKKKRLLTALNAVIGGYNFRTISGNSQLARDVRFMAKMYDKGGRFKDGADHALSSLFDKIFENKQSK